MVPAQAAVALVERPELVSRRLEAEAPGPAEGLGEKQEGEEHLDSRGEVSSAFLWGRRYLGGKQACGEEHELTSDLVEFEIPGSL